jgi:type III secretion protein Q
MSVTTSYLRRLRRVGADEALASRRLGRGKVFHCTGKEYSVGYLALHRAPKQEQKPSGDWLALDTAAGMIALDASDAEALLNQLSDVPFVTASADGDEQAWYAALYDQHLLPGFRRLFGHLRPLAPPRDEAHAGLRPYRLAWRFGEHGGHLPLALADATLERLLGRAPWRVVSYLDTDRLTIRTPLRLGWLQLARDEVMQLGLGDVLIATQPLFSVAGEGIAQLAGARLQLHYQDDGTRNAYRVTHLHTTAEDDPLMHDDYDMDTGLAHADTETASPHTRLTLSLQAGEISLSLAELAQLEEGSVLVAAGEAPGHATLYHRQRPIARGELVDVEGRLGVQLTQILLPVRPFDDPGTDDAP